MTLLVLTLIVMLACAYAQYRNGLFSSVAMLMMVLLSGVVAFGFWEPIANFLDPVFQNNTLAGSEDLISLTVLFSLTLFLLRLATNYLAPDLIEEQGTIQHFGGAGVGLITGYLVAGFLIVTIETLPLEENFLGFQPRSTTETAYRPLMPPDRVWLSLMRHGSAFPFNWKADPQPTSDALVDRYITFDREATFELRYQRYRRGMDGRPPANYLGEFDKELGRQAGP
ncbi:MAG: CvpA family protein [Planctomycetes bacterium]|nr:CvpA family protein [Planctomycetota bacterium]